MALRLEPLGRQHRALLKDFQNQHASLVEYLLTGDVHGFVDLKKGGACLLALAGDPQPGHTELRWLLTAAQLRSLEK